MDIFLIPETWIALLTLTFMEIVLGVDNIIFISIVSNKLAEEQQKRVRLIGLALALIFRIGLLASITYIIGMTKPLFTIPWMELEVSIRDLILFLGGMFLIAKSTIEIGQKMEGMGKVRNRRVNLRSIQLLYKLFYLILFFHLIQF